jgi:PAS domain S-box-containing protein
MSDTTTPAKTGLVSLLFLTGAVLLYNLSRANYLLFHGLAEMFGVAIAGGIAMIAWNSRNVVRRHFLLFIGLGYPFVGLLSLLHTFAYKGLSVFPSAPGANLPTQLWIAARFLECGTFLAAPHFLNRKVLPALVLTGYTLVTGLILASLFVWPVFPDCYVDGVGLTSFKKVSEYLISLVWLVVIFILLAHREKFDAPVLRQLLVAVACNIAAELSFALYVDVYGVLNFSGHFLRIIGVYFFYRAIIEKSLREPYRSLFRELHQSEQRYRNIYETAPLAFVVWDQECRVTQWNRAAEKIFGWTSAETIGKNFLEFLIPAKERPAVEVVVAALNRGEIVNHSINANLTKAGGTIICEWNNSIMPDQDGNPSGVVLSLGLDITEQKKAEEVLRQQSEMIKRFAYSVVHDLKNPAGSLSALAELFQRRYGDALDDRGRRFCDQIKQTSRQISELVQNINTYIAAKELTLQVENFELRELFELLRQEFAGRVAERQISWAEPEQLPAIRADKIALLRILRNFVDNALKYGGPALSRIEIGYRATPEHHQFFVQDDGVGLPTNTEEKIFEIFHRGQTASGTSGAGLGLAITRELAEKMGGEVWAERPADHGTIFFIYIAKGL